MKLNINYFKTLYIDIIMNYDLQKQELLRREKITPSRIEYNLDRAMPYGDMPSTMLTSKFEETDMGPDEDLYENYARGLCVDNRPDAPAFEHERSRGGVNQSAGKLQILHHGHRGDADVGMPELFLGFGGDADRDPRGINVDPDMKKLTEQERSRMRFQRFSSDMCDQVTGGGRSEFQLMADQQKLQRITRDRLKVFNRQIDGRREGLRRIYKHKSDVAKQVLVQSYGDYVRDYALNPQRRANIICHALLVDTKEYRNETADQDFEVAKYTQICRSRVKKIGKRAETAQDSDMKDGDNTKTFKAVGVLMANIVRCKKQAIETQKGDMDFSDVKQFGMRKSQPIVRDLALILRSLAKDQDMQDGDMTMTVKTAHRATLEHQARLITMNHLRPAHHALNAEILYKSVKPGADLRKVADLVIGDARKVDALSEAQRGKMAAVKMRSGRKLNTDNDADAAESDNTMNYKQLLTGPERKMLKVNGENFKTESDDTQHRREAHKNHRTTNTRDVSAVGINFANNAVKERMTGGLGSKYMNRFIDTDSKNESVSSDRGGTNA